MQPTAVPRKAVIGGKRTCRSLYYACTRVCVCLHAPEEHAIEGEFDDECMANYLVFFFLQHFDCPRVINSKSPARIRRPLPIVSRCHNNNNNNSNTPTNSNRCTRN